MDEVKISDLPVFNGSIDPTTDMLPIVNNSDDETQKINRNTYLGITGNPLGTTDTQTVSAKTINNTNAATLLDTGFTLQDNSDNTKQIVFQLSNVTTATTRTITFPNASATLASLTGTETFTNKTLTTPTIAGGSITGSTISVNAISEETPANGVTVDGLNIKDGKLNTNNSVVTANVTDSAITPAKLLAGTGTGWTWNSWTPTWANFTVGNGVNSSTYTQIGKTVVARISFTLGTTSSMGTAPTFTLPVASVPGYVAGFYLGGVRLVAAGTGHEGVIHWATSTTAFLVAQNSATAYLTEAAVTASIPNSWTNDDQIRGTLVYEAA
jgi:hypothetical protein